MPVARHLFISDVHGQTSALRLLLKLVDYDPRRDLLLLLGDHVGRGAQSLECLRAIRRLCQEDGTVALQGNHDRALLEWLSPSPPRSDPPRVYDYIPELAREIRREQPDLGAFVQGMPLWYEGQTFLAVHAGFHPDRADWRQATPEECTTIRSPFLERMPRDPRTVIFGHTPCQRLHGSPEVWFGPGKVGIDGGAGHGQQLNCLVADQDGLRQFAVPLGSGG